MRAKWLFNQVCYFELPLNTSHFFPSNSRVAQELAERALAGEWADAAVDAAAAAAAAGATRVGRPWIPLSMHAWISRVPSAPQTGWCRHIVRSSPANERRETLTRDGDLIKYEYDNGFSSLYLLLVCISSHSHQITLGAQRMSWRPWCLSSVDHEDCLFRMF